MAKPLDLPVDHELIRSLAALLDETGLIEIEYAQGDRRIRVVRGSPAPVTAAPVVVAPPPPAAAEAPRPAPAEHPGAVKAPMVGTAYLSAQPGEPPFVKLGDRVTEGQVLLIIEAMKVMNQIRAARAGRVAEIIVGDGSPVEFGQVLLVLE
jgi:acetyl-CoA carboxylase biotin carboxyl carrier protein